MGLPKINQPLFELTIPSTQQKVKYRPFTVKEEKILLVAQQSGELEQIVLAIKQIIGNCIEGIDAENLAMFDIEYIMLKIRAQSVNNEIQFTIKDPETKEDVPLTINLNDVELKKNQNHTNIIELGPEFKIVMRYPTLNELKALANANNATDALFDAMIGCIDSIVEGEDTVYQLKEFPQKEIDEFVESLTSKTVSDIRQFFETVPVLRIECPYTNSKGNQKTFVVEGLQSFFI